MERAGGQAELGGGWSGKIRRREKKKTKTESSWERWNCVGEENEGQQRAGKLYSCSRLIELAGSEILTPAEGSRSDDGSAMGIPPPKDAGWNAVGWTKEPGP